MICEIDIKKLNEAAYNPRIKLQPEMPEWEKLKKSIEDFGNVEPIVWNKRTGNVVGGHQRLAVLKSMGCEKIPCSVVDLDERDEKLLNLALNKIKGRWDYDKLEDLLKEFDIEVAAASGFAADEIAIILSNDEDLEEDEEPDYKEDFWADTPTVGGSYVVTLIFRNADQARDFAEAEGLKDKIKEGTTSTVIRME